VPRGQGDLPLAVRLSAELDEAATRSKSPWFSDLKMVS
jgi:hypothetical protein